MKYQLEKEIVQFVSNGANKFSDVDLRTSKTDRSIKVIGWNDLAFNQKPPVIKTDSLV